MDVIVAGDFCERYRVKNCIDNKNHAELFDGIPSILSENHINIVNFEFPIVLDNGNPIKKFGPTLKGSENSIEALKFAGFNVCTLANNHILDQGANCCLQTKEVLENNGILTVGAGANAKEASNILYVKDGEETLAIVNCCESEFSIAQHDSAGANALNPIRQYYAIQEAKKNADYVIVIVHAGIETYQLPTPRMVENYRFFIDAGASAVVNHHQHCFSGYEIYSGKPIFYGLGNFLFDNPSSRYGTWNEGYLVKLKFNDASVSFELYPYTQCNDTPRVQLMSKEEKATFKKRIIELNNIISDPSLLKTNLDEFSKQRHKYILSFFTPWSSNRLMTAAYTRGLLPSFFTDKKKLALKNRLICESHYDITVNELMK